MTRRSVTLVACAPVVLTACVFEGASSSGKTADAHAQDMAGIEKLHTLDVAAILSGDVAALSEGWSALVPVKDLRTRMGDTEMSAIEGAPTTPPGEDELKLYEAYADGKMKRYTLLFAVNGGALAIAQAYHETGLLGMLTVPKLAVGAICFSWIMLWDIWSFGEMMRKRYDALWKKKKNDPTRLKVFTPVGQLILLLLVVLVTAAWVLAAIDAGSTSGTTGGT